MATRKSTQPAPAAFVNLSAEAVFSPVIAHPCAPLGAIILDLGARLGTLDKLSRKIMAELLQELTEAPDDAPEIASVASSLARVQKPMVRDAALHRAMTHPDAREYVAVKGEQS